MRPGHNTRIAMRTVVLVAIALFTASATSQTPTSSNPSSLRSEWRSITVPDTQVEIGVPTPVATTTPAPEGACQKLGRPWWTGLPGAPTCYTGFNMCGLPAVYRLDQGGPEELGDCAGIFLVPPPSVTIRVGHEIDVSLTGDTSAAGAVVPVWPLPTSSNSAVLLRTAVSEDGLSASFVAKAPGASDLQTLANCMRSSGLPWDSSSDLVDPTVLCPILTVTVIA